MTAGGPALSPTAAMQHTKVHVITLVEDFFAIMRCRCVAITAETVISVSVLMHLQYFWCTAIYTLSQKYSCMAFLVEARASIVGLQ